MASDLRKTILDPADVIQAEGDQLLAEMRAMSPKELTSRATEMRDRMVGLIWRQGEPADRLSRGLAALNMQRSRETLSRRRARPYRRAGLTLSSPKGRVATARLTPRWLPVRPEAEPGVPTTPGSFCIITSA